MQFFCSPKWLALLLLAVQQLWLPAQTANPLMIPDTLSGTSFQLTMAPAKVGFLPGDSSDTYGINTSYLGKTLILQKGDFVQLDVTNNISDTTTMHWHGLHVAAADDGGPHTPIPPGVTWSPNFTILDEAATYWYHPHLHHKTAEQVYKGAAGMIIVRDGHEATLNLPRTYGVDDFPLIIQDKSFDSLTNQFIYTELSDTMMVNGTLNPYLEVPAQMVRFRILNASAQRVYNIGLPPTWPYWQIASDGGLLERPIFRPRVLLAPGERAEIVVNFGILTVGTSGALRAFNTEMVDGVSGGPNGPGGGPGNPLDGSDFDILDLRVVAQNSNAVTAPPDSILNTFQIWDELDAARTRVKVFTVDSTGWPFYINNTIFDHDVVNDTVLIDDIEVWEIRNETDVAHPFHIHDIQFHILDINGQAPAPTLAGRKDVVLTVPGDTIRFITKFDDFMDPATPYMYHCHNLFHEDGGMMGQFIVVDSSFIGIQKPVTDFAGLYRCYPNPATDQIRIQALGRDVPTIDRVKLLDICGRELKTWTMNGISEVHTLSLPMQQPGIYFLQIENRTGAIGTLRFMQQ